MTAPTILIVEDNPITRRAVRGALESAGYTVVEAPDGRTALELMANQPADLVLQDLLLPDIDGFELLKHLRQVPGGAEIPILAFSGFLPKMEQAQSLQVGFTDYLFKPVERSRLLATIQAYLPRATAVKEKQTEGRRVLVADDDPVQRKLLKVHLEERGFRVTTAVDGTDCLEQARRSPPDAIVSDVVMPRLDGFRLCEALRQDPSMAHIPVVLTSSYFPDDANGRLVEHVGASPFMVRRPDPQEVITALLASLSKGSPPAPAPPVELPTDENTLRLMRQLERQVEVTVSLTRRLSMLEARFAILDGLAETLKTTSALETILHDLLHRFVDAAGASHGAAYLLEPDGHFSLGAQFGYPDPQPESLRDFFGHADLLSRVLREAEPLAVPSSKISEKQSSSLLASAGAKTLLIGPLITGGNPLGVLMLDSGSRDLGPEWVSFAKAVGAQLAQAIGLARAHAQIAAAEAKYRTLVEQTPAITYTAAPDPRRTTLYISPKLKVILGFSPPEWLSDPEFWVKQLHPEDRARVLAEFARSQTGEGGFTAEYRMLARDGRVRWFHDEAVTVRDSGGRPHLVQGFILDITHRKEAEAEANQNRLEAEAFAELFRELAGSLVLDPILQRVVAQARHLAQADFSFLALADRTGRALVVGAQTGTTSTALKGMTVQKGEGMAGTVLATGELLVTDDYLQDPQFSHTPEADAAARAEGTVVQAAVPILHEGKPLGVLMAARRTPRPFTLADLQVLIRLSDAASLACHHGLLYEQATARAAALEHLWRAGQVLIRPLVLREAYDRIVQAARDLLGTAYALLTVWNPGTQRLTIAAHAGAPPVAPDREFPLSEGGVGIVAATRQSLIIYDYQAFPARLPELPTITAVLVVPLLVEERLIGTLSVGVTQQGRVFTAEDRQLLELLAQPAAIALENARLYEELKREALLLEARVEERTEELQAAMRRADEASRYKSEFLAHMSHELRTPLNAIIGFSELLQTQSFGVLNEKQTRYAKNILLSGRHLLTVINDILDLSKVEAGRLELRPEHFPFPEFLGTALADIRPHAEKKEVRLELVLDETLSHITADPVRCKQILYNLLSNAVKFTPPGGRVTLAARNVDSAFVEIAVTDTGIGIKADDLSKLFEPFTQLESALSKGHQGTGLGLALTKRLVELHRGQIWAESEGAGKGTTFRVRLPLATEG